MSEAGESVSFAGEEVLCAKMPDRSSQGRSSNSQDEIQTANNAVEEVNYVITSRMSE